jgi:hypothetical protein
MVQTAQAVGVEAASLEAGRQECLLQASVVADYGYLHHVWDLT